jgi:hypothetical protein
VHNRYSISNCRGTLLYHQLLYNNNQPWLITTRHDTLITNLSFSLPQSNMTSSTKPPKAILFDIGGVVVRTTYTASHPLTTGQQLTPTRALGNKSLPSHPRLRNRKQHPRRLHQLRHPTRPPRHRRLAAHRARRSRTKRCMVHLLRRATLAPRSLFLLPRQASQRRQRHRRRASHQWRAPASPPHRRQTPLLAHDED